MKIRNTQGNIIHIHHLNIRNQYTLPFKKKKQYQLREAWFLKRPDDIKQISLFTKLCDDAQVLRVSTDTDKSDHVFMS